MHILHTVKKRGWSGETHLLLMLALGQAARGHRMSVVASPTSQTAERAHAAGLDVFGLAFDRPAHRLPVVPGGRRLLEFLRRERVDVAHCHASFDHWVLSRLAHRAGSLLVRTKHNRKYIRRHPMNRWLYVRATDAVVAISGAVRDDFRATRFFAADVEVIPNGIDLSRFAGIDRVAARRTLGIDGPVLAYVGRITERKRVDRLLEAAEAVARRRPGLTTLVAGTGDPAVMRSLRTRFDRPAVRFMGQRDDVPRLLAAADVLCCPARDEAFGLVPLEAMASGCPVVLADEPGLRQYAVHGVNALLVPEATVAGLAEAILLLLRDRGTADRLRAAGRETACAHSIDVTIRRYLRLYDRLLAAR